MSLTYRRRFLNWLATWMNPFSIIAFALVLFAVISMGWGVSEAVRGWNFDKVGPFVLAAFFSSWALAKLKAKWWLGILAGVFLGFLVNYFVVGQLADEFAELAYQIKFVYDAWRDEFAQTNLFRVKAAIENIWFDGVFMSQRLYIWLLGFPSPPVDPVAAMLVWGFSLWGAGSLAGWWLARHQHPVAALLPSAILLGVSRSLSGLSATPIYPLLAAALGAMVLLGYVSREAEWRKRKIGFSQLIRENTAWAALALTLSLVVFSGFTAAVDWEEVMDRLRDPETPKSTSKARAAEALGVERPSDELLPEEIFGRMTVGGLPTKILVDSGPELSDQLIMYVDVEVVDRATGRRQPATGNEIYYYRALTFDRYTSQGWISSVGRIHSYSADQPAIREYSSNEQLLYQKVTHALPYNGVVVAIGELAVVDNVYRIAYRSRDIGGELVDEFGALIENERSYEAFSVIPDYGEDELRETGQSMPDWVLDKYLQLPSSVPQRVLDLAFELTLEATTPYDRAVVLEQYLRQFPYTLDLPERPAGLDLADYFLFDLQRGYCDYYASTMIVMARAVGLPARLATGYIGGTYDESQNRFVITGDTAHSWVEIYFPDFGWVVFEPTAGRAPIDRIVERQDIDIFAGQVMSVPEPFRLHWNEIIRWAGLGFLVSGVLTLLSWSPIDRFILKRQNPALVLARLYRRLHRFSRWLGAQTSPAQTPTEFIIEFEHRLSALRLSARAPWLWGRVQPRMVRLVKQCADAAYLPEPPKETARMLAIATWTQMRWPLWLAFIFVRISRLSQVKRRVNVKQKLRNG